MKELENTEWPGILQTHKKENYIWKETEKEFLLQYVQSTSRSAQESVTEYWQKCADLMNKEFSTSHRNGNACKSLAQRLFVTPGSVSAKPRLYASDVGTQTEFPDISGGQKADWVFMDPKKELKEGASKTAEALHHTAVKRLRQYSPLTDSEKTILLNVIDSGTPRQIARTVLGTGSLGEELKSLLIFDAEMDACECANKGSALYCQNYESLLHFKWDNVISELIKRQQFLAEVLLAISLPSDKIGNSKATKALIPVLGTTYAVLMKQRYYA